VDGTTFHAFLLKWGEYYLVLVFNFLIFSYQLDIGIGFSFHSNQILKYGPKLIFGWYVAVCT
jgi:hypothetical protein